MQEQIQWDARSIDYALPLYTRLFSMFLFIAVVWLFVAIIRSIWLTYSWPNTRRGTFRLLLQALQSGDLEQVSALALKIPERSPECGLRRLANLQQEAGNRLDQITRQADIAFRVQLARLSTVAINLQRLFTLLLLLTGSWTAYGLANTFKGISADKATGLSAVYGGYSEVAAMLSVNLFVAGALYAVRWRIASAALRRERLWCALKSHLELLIPANRQS